MIENYLYPNISDEDAINLIKEKITTNTPFSYIRFGDGEILIMNDKKHHEQFQGRVCGQCGLEYPKDVDKAFSIYREILWNTFIKSDMIGISNFINKISFQQGWSLKKSIVNERNINIDELLIATHILPRHPNMGEMNGMKNLIQGNDIHIISPNKDLLIKNKIDKKLGVNITYTDHTKINYGNRDTLIESFKDIKENIVLYGTSLNKDYGIILRDKHGKISIDMGSVLDAWSGLGTRPEYREGNKHSYLTIKN